MDAEEPGRSARLPHHGGSGIDENLTSARIIDLGFLRECVDDAQDAINSPWEDKGRTFWRSTRQRKRETDHGNLGTFYPTVTLRCISAMLSLIREVPDWASQQTMDLLKRTYVAAIIGRTIDDLRKSKLDVADAKEPNVFTLSIYIQTFARILTLDSLSPDNLSVAGTRLEAGLQALVDHPALAGTDTSKVHPFLSYHVKRALIVGGPHATEAKLGQSVHRLARAVDGSCRDAIAEILAKHKLGSLNPSEAVALAFCAAVLSTGEVALPRVPAPSAGDPRVNTSVMPPDLAPGSSGVAREDRQSVLAALSVCLEAQDPAGCWPLGRVVQTEDKDVVSDWLEITTFEVADAVAETLTGLLRNAAGNADGRFDALVTTAATRLLRSGRFAERSVVRLSGTTLPRVGWCSDHAYGYALIESWTSAAVLEAVLGLSTFAQEFNRLVVLSSFTTVAPTDRDWPRWLRWGSFRSSGEVDHDRPILEYLERKLIKPILADPRRLPRARPRSVSVLLFGPPGTSKTTIVKAVADALGWPVVLLSPGNFIERGLEYIEAQARSVFDRLMQLSRTVVIFDECDELFRSRAPRPESEQMRGITAFVTASMLPKLQELHDRGRVVFFICTNNFHAMDAAIKRGGRIDHIIGVGPPDKTARALIVTASLKNLRDSSDWRELPFLDQACDELVNLTDRFTRPELDRAVAALTLQGAKERWPKEAKARAAAREFVERRRDSLTITTPEHNRFLRQRRKFSHAYTEGA